MGKAIMITSREDGVGKTTASTNMGTGLAILGKRVVLIDTDIGLRSPSVVMGLEDRIVYNLVDVVKGNCCMKQTLVRDKRYSNLYLLPSAQTRDKTSVNPEQMIKLVDDLREGFSHVLLDYPIGTEQGLYNAITGADRALVITTPEVSAIRGTDRIIGLLERTEIDKIDLIVSRIRADMVHRRDIMSLSDATDILAMHIIGAVPDDESIVISTSQRGLLVGLGSTTGQAYPNIYRRIPGESIPMANPGETETFFARLRGVFKRA